MNKLILASKSEARAFLLRKIGIECDIFPSNFDERAANVEHLPATEQAAFLALHKALDVSRKFPEAVIIGADQILEFEGNILHKAENLAELREKLLNLRGKTHFLHSGVCLVQNSQLIWQHVETATLTMRNFSDEFLAHYIETYGEKVRGSVGGYHYEGAGLQLMERVEGDYYTILGMPLLQMMEPLRATTILQN